MRLYENARTLAKSITVGLGAVLALQSGAYAAATPNYQGEFQVDPKVEHTSPISGKMTLSFDGTTLTQVLLNLDQPVFGSSTFSSSEQWSAVAGIGSSSDLVVVFKLQGPPHTFYFVMTTSSPDGGVTLNGTIYRVNDTMADIQAIVTHNFSGAPSSWDNVGDATLKGL